MQTTGVFSCEVCGGEMLTGYSQAHSSCIRAANPMAVMPPRNQIETTFSRLVRQFQMLPVPPPIESEWSPEPTKRITQVPAAPVKAIGVKRPVPMSAQRLDFRQDEEDQQELADIQAVVRDSIQEHGFDKALESELRIHRLAMRIFCAERGIFTK